MKKEKQKKINELAYRIRKARIAAHLSQSLLGEAIGVSDKSVSAYESGRSIPPFAKLKEIALKTKHPLQYFTDDSTNAGTVVAKLQVIEQELEQIKKLLKRTQK